VILCAERGGLTESVSGEGFGTAARAAWQITTTTYV